MTGISSLWLNQESSKSKKIRDDTVNGEEKIFQTLQFQNDVKGHFISFSLTLDI